MFMFIFKKDEEEEEMQFIYIVTIHNNIMRWFILG